MNNFFQPGPDGKPVFVGKEDPSNRPYTPPPVNSRFCSSCKEYVENDDTCPKCGRAFDDSKMKCPVCGKWFDYLVGDDTPDGGRRGCEGCWRAPKRPIRKEDVGDDTKDVFGE